MKLKTVLRSTVRHPKKIPLWLRRMDLVKAEMKTVRFPARREKDSASASSYLKTCVVGSGNLFEPTIRRRPKKRSRMSDGFYWPDSVPLKCAR